MVEKRGSVGRRWNKNEKKKKKKSNYTLGKLLIVSFAAVPLNSRDWPGIEPRASQAHSVNSNSNMLSTAPRTPFSQQRTLRR